MLQAIRDALGGVVNALQGVVKAKQEAATPLVEAATRTGTFFHASAIHIYTEVSKPEFSQTGSECYPFSMK